MLPRILYGIAIMCANEENRDTNAQGAAHKYTRNENQDERHHFFNDGNFFSTGLTRHGNHLGFL